MRTVQLMVMITFGLQCSYAGDVSEIDSVADTDQKIVDFSESSGTTSEESSPCEAGVENWVTLDMSRFFANGLHVDESGFYVIDGRMRGLWHISTERALATPLFESWDRQASSVSETPGFRLSSTESVSTDLQTDTSHIYWGTDKSNIFRVSKSGGPPELLASHQGDNGGAGQKVTAFYLASPFILYSLEEGPLQSVSVKGGEPTVLVDEPRIGWVSNDTERLYWTQTLDSGMVTLNVKSHVESSVAEIWRASNPKSSKFFKLHDGFIYWWLDDVLVRIAAGGGKLEHVAAVDEFDDDSFDYFIFGDEVYWTSSSGEVWKAPLHPDSRPPEEPSNHSAVQLAKMGPFDDDDYAPMLARWQNHIYWQAGANPAVKASDDDSLTLFRACLSN